MKLEALLKKFIIDLFIDIICFVDFRQLIIRLPPLIDCIQTRKNSLIKFNPKITKWHSIFLI
jgi:hypothetical protein